MNLLVGHIHVKKFDCGDVTHMSEQDWEAEHTPTSEEQWKALNSLSETVVMISVKPFD